MRFKLPPPCGETMALGLSVWLCCLPVVLLVAWFFGLGLPGALAGAGVALGVILVACWGICVSRVLDAPRPRGRTNL